MSEQKTYTLEEFVAQAKQDLDDYQKDWTPPNSNEFHEGKHTWAEWWGTFGRYFSWEER
jgi:hypothetical protein